MKLSLQCRNDLEINGLTMLKIAMPSEVKELLLKKDLIAVDEFFKGYLITAPITELFKSATHFENLEFIVARRSADNPDEEDGIWHDDGSRIFAFSLSLTLEKVTGGELGFRRKNQEEFKLIPTQEYGTMILFKTGTSGFEHKVHQVTSGERIVVAGWLT